jgi:predicted nucleotide-binding protein
MGRKQIPEKRQADLRPEQMRKALLYLKKRVEELKTVQFDKITEFRDPVLQGLQKKVISTLSDVFGANTIEFDQFGHVNLFPYGRIFVDGGPSIPEIQQTYRNGIATTISDLEVIISRFEEKLSVEDPGSTAFATSRLTDLDIHPETARVMENRELSTSRPGSASEPQAEAALSPSSPDPKKVFIIHGRNIEAPKQMGIFLRALGLLPITFPDLRARMGGTAHIDEIVEKGMSEAQGVIAIFTPDEYAAVQPQYRRAQDRIEEITRWQARPNVIFEAGMAFGRARNRVVFVLFGNPTLFTDVDGVHVLRPNNDPGGDRATLRNLLAQGMNCAVEHYSNEWITAGNFETCASLVPGVLGRDPFGETGDANAEPAQTDKSASLSPAAKVRLEEIRDTCLQAGDSEYQSINFIVDTQAENRVFRELQRSGYVESNDGGASGWRLTDLGADAIANLAREAEQTMKGPDEVIPPLTDEQKRKVAEIKAQVYEILAKRSEYQVNINSTRREISEAVWEQVVSDARDAGWDASMNGSMVTIRKPRQ